MPGGARLSFQVQQTGEVIRVQPRHVLIVGFAGRDAQAVRQHINELAAHGVAIPARTPELYAVSPHLLSQSRVVEVGGGTTSGEAEYILALHAGEVFVGIGSDHTDRALERRDILAGKEACPKPLGRKVWRLEQVEGRWDDLELRSWVGTGRSRRPYQEGRLGMLLSPAAVLEFIRGEGGPLEEAIIFGGTIPLLRGEFATEPWFAAELRDPRQGRTLGCRYRTRTRGVDAQA